MGRMTAMAMGACAAVFCGSAASAGVMQTITLDGDLGEWHSEALFYSDAEIGDASTADAGYHSVYVANDAENLYLGIRTDGAGGGTIFNDWSHNLFLDTDTLAATGFNGGWMAHGYDFLVQYGNAGSTFSVYSFAGAAQSDWAWSFVDTFDYSFAGDVIEWRIPLALLGDPAAAVVQLNVTGGSAGGETWAGAAESGAKTYSLAVPEPASLGLVAVGGVLLGLRRRGG